MVDLKSTEDVQDNLKPEPPIEETKLVEENKELINQIQRLQAEFDNYRKRVQKEKEAFAEQANEKLIRKILPVIDTFELALKSKPDEGMQMIHDQLKHVLEESGLKTIDSVGKFNPALHEVLIAEISEEDPGIILEEFQKGYVLGDRVLRHSKVKIAKKENDEDSEEE